MAVSKISLLLAALVSLSVPPLKAQADLLEPGIAFFLKGDLDGAVKFFDKRVKREPSDRRASQMLGNCLAMRGKKMLGEGRYQEGLKNLSMAETFLPERADLKTLRLLAELDSRLPTEKVAVSTEALASPSEKWAFFDCVFGVGQCGAFGASLIHVVGRGETMSTIAEKYYGDYRMWEKIWKANPKLPNPHRLEKGTRLVIPPP